jgi:hypothetical protein
MKLLRRQVMTFALSASHNGMPSLQSNGRCWREAEVCVPRFLSHAVQRRFVTRKVCRCDHYTYCVCVNGFACGRGTGSHWGLLVQMAICCVGGGSALDWWLSDVWTRSGWSLRPIHLERGVMLADGLSGGGGGGSAVCVPSCNCNLAFALQLREVAGNLILGSRKVSGTALSVDLPSPCRCDCC